MPHYELLGGRIRDQVRVYANGWYGSARTLAEFATASEWPLREGYDALKGYPLSVPDENGLRHVTRRMVDRDFAGLAFEKVRALRGAVGPEVEIMLDLSGGLTTDETEGMVAPRTGASTSSTFFRPRAGTRPAATIQSYPQAEE